jgi:NAD(P)-dependent dehydrogenase (short-subunit alcohol dehydrogenase family)
VTFYMMARLRRAPPAHAALVNNAGMAYKGDAWGVDVARNTMATNLHGTVAVTEALLPFLRAAAAAHPERSARIVNVCSQAGRLGQMSPTLQTAFQEASSLDDVLALADGFVAAVGDGSYAAKGWPKS